MVFIFLKQEDEKEMLDLEPNDPIRGRNMKADEEDIDPYAELEEEDEKPKV